MADHCFPPKGMVSVSRKPPALSPAGGVVISERARPTARLTNCLAARYSSANKRVVPKGWLIHGDEAGEACSSGHLDAHDARTGGIDGYRSGGEPRRVAPESASRVGRPHRAQPSNGSEVCPIDRCRRRVVARDAGASRIVAGGTALSAAAAAAAGRSFDALGPEGSRPLCRRVRCRPTVRRW